MSIFSNLKNYLSNKQKSQTKPPISTPTTKLEKKIIQDRQKHENYYGFTHQSTYYKGFLTVNPDPNLKHKCDKDVYKMFMYDETEANLEGARTKAFFRCESGLFPHLIYDLKSNRNSSFTTYADELLRDGYTPETLSCLAYTHSTSNANPNRYNEVFNCNILRHFNIPTAYYTTCLDNETGQSYVLSVDFLKQDEELVSLYDKANMVTHKPEQTFRIAEHVYKNAFKDGSHKAYKQHLKNFPEFKKDFYKTFLYRKFLIGDGDYSSMNIGLTINDKEKTINIATQYDLENINDYEKPYNEMIEEDLKYIYKDCPEAFEEVINSINTCLKTDKTGKNKFEQITCNLVEDNIQNIALQKSKIYTQNAENLVEFYNTKLLNMEKEL